MAEAVVSSSEVTKGARRLVRLSELCDAAGISANLQALIDNPEARARFINHVQGGWNAVFSTSSVFQIAERLNPADVREFISFAVRSERIGDHQTLTIDDVVEYYCDGEVMLDLLYRETNSRKCLVIALFFGFLPDGKRWSHAEIADRLKIDQGRVAQLKREGSNIIGSVLSYHLATDKAPERVEGTSIQILGLPARLVGKLSRHGIRTVEKLKSMSADNLLELRGNPVGGEYLRQIEEALKTYDGSTLQS